MIKFISKSEPDSKKSDNQNSYIEYFRQIKRYIQENKKNFTPEQKTDKCSPTLDD